MFLKSLPWIPGINDITLTWQHNLPKAYQITAYQTQEGSPENKEGNEEKEVEELRESNISLSSRGKIQIETAQVA